MEFCGNNCLEVLLTTCNFCLWQHSANQRGVATPIRCPEATPWTTRGIFKSFYKNPLFLFLFLWIENKKNHSSSMPSMPLIDMMQKCYLCLVNLIDILVGVDSEKITVENWRAREAAQDVVWSTTKSK